MSVNEQIERINQLFEELKGEKRDLELSIFEAEKSINSRTLEYMKKFDQFYKEKKKLEELIEKQESVQAEDNNKDGILIDYITFSHILNAVSYGIRDEELYNKLLVMGVDNDLKNKSVVSNKLVSNKVDKPEDKSINELKQEQFSIPENEKELLRQLFGSIDKNDFLNFLNASILNSINEIKK